MKQLCLCAAASFAVGTWVPLHRPLLPRKQLGRGGAPVEPGREVEGRAQGVSAGAGSAGRCGIQVWRTPGTVTWGQSTFLGSEFKNIRRCSSAGRALMLPGGIGALAEQL